MIEIKHTGELNGECPYVLVIDGKRYEVDNEVLDLIYALSIERDSLLRIVNILLKCRMN